MPKAVEQKFVDGKEVARGLPPRNARDAYVVDEYPACPQNWMRSSGEVSSYFVPVLPEHGLWFDFNENKKHTHHVAVVISVQGINAVTGQKTDKLRLEQYKKKCPIHNEPFGHERFCEKCGYKWPQQNYLASNVTPNPYFWLDGFRSQDGEVRQYVFTEEIARGVAAQLIGEERVFAIGIAFYLSKEVKPPEPVNVVHRYDWTVPTHFYTPQFTYDVSSAWTSSSIGTRGLSAGGKSSSMGDVNLCAGTDNNVLHLTNEYELISQDSIVGLDSFESVETVETTKLEISAGAKINQKIYPDTEKLSFWQKEPAGIIYINYVPTEDAEKIIAAGKIDMTAKGEGFLRRLNVGNALGK